MSNTYPEESSGLRARKKSLATLMTRSRWHWRRWRGVWGALPPAWFQSVEISGNFILFGQYCIKILGNFIFFWQVCVKILGNLVFIKPSQFFFSVKTFFFLEVTLNSDRKTVSISVKTFLFFWRSSKFGQQNRLNFSEDLFFWRPP